MKSFARSSVLTILASLFAVSALAAPSWFPEGLQSMPSVTVGEKATTHASAVLEVKSTAKGAVCAPVMTSTQRDAISSPTRGLQVYNSTTDKLNVFNGTSWIPLDAGAGSIGDVVESATSLVTWSITANQYGDLTSISLPAGSWSINAMAYSDNGGAVTTTEFLIGIGTSSGNNPAGLTYGINTAAVNPLSGSTGNSRTLNVNGYIVNPGSTTTYYLKGLAGNNISNLRVRSRITAVRLSP